MRRIYLFIGTLIVIGLLSWAGIAIAGSKTPAEQQIDSLQQQAAGAGDPTAAALLLEKAAPLSAAQAAQATAQANAPQKSSELCGLAPALDANATPAPTVEIPRGISDWLQPPFSTQDVTVTNQWNDQVDGVWLTAYAGALGQDPEQGVIIAVDAQGNYTRYLLGAGSGAAQFVAAEGALVTVETTGGATLTLDMAKLALTDSAGTALAGTLQAAPEAIAAPSLCK
ncbi:hypothetical protein FDZ74_07975 [bacterium]|nr:MAG: hypothetical protein FDZ74_07975 [bacterium]